MAARGIANGFKLDSKGASDGRHETLTLSFYGKGLASPTRLLDVVPVESMNSQLIAMGARVNISIVEGSFKRLASKEGLNRDSLGQHACGAGDGFSLCEPVVKIESDGEIFVVEESSAWPCFREKQLPGDGLYAVCTDARSHWFSEEDHNASDTWFACNALHSDMAANAVDPVSFSYSQEGCMWRYKDEEVKAAISAEAPSEKKIVVLDDGKLVEAVS